MPQKLIIIFSTLVFSLGLILLMITDTTPNLAENPPASEREEIKDFFFTSLDGTKHALSDFRGKIVFINSWFTRCPPCRKEMPELLELAHKHPEDMVFIALSVDREKAAVQRFISGLPEKTRAQTKSKNVFFIHDEGSLISRKSLGVKGFPETIIVDREGRQLYKIKGIINWLGPKVERLFSKQSSPNDQVLEHTHDSSE